MLSTDLFTEILIEPARKGANNLFIVSGYATAAMAFHHFEALRNQNLNIRLNLIVGMAIQDGLSQSNHLGFQSLMQNDLADVFECSYVMLPPPVHSKIYVWFEDQNPHTAFIGSANYSQKAFGSRQREILTTSNAEEGYAYYQALSKDTIYCTHPDAENFVQVFNDQYYARRKREVVQSEDKQLSAVTSEIYGLEHVKVSFIDKNGEISHRAGLNWGQRPELGREPNQAYIPLKVGVYRSSFFPPITQHFTVHTDDQKILLCARAQQNGKAIHTPRNNSQIGEYFRNRLNVPNGYPVLMEHFLQYGRADVDFYKIDEENYYMDFSPPSIK